MSRQKQKKPQAGQQIKKQTTQQVTERIGQLLLLLICLVATSACVTTQSPTAKDPYENFNRHVFQFNESIDKAVLRPTAVAYQKVVPQLARNGVTNFFQNIRNLPIAANKLLQGNVTASAETLTRFVVNTLFGLGGLFDMATQASIPKYQSDFGITLGRWGVPMGPYLVLPLLGPSTFRDTASLGAEWFTLPTTYIKSFPARATLFGLFIVNTRTNLLVTTDIMADVAFDKYTFMRDAYLQRRVYLANEDKKNQSNSNGETVDNSDDVNSDDINSDDVKD